MDRFLEMEVFADVVERKSFSATARARALSPSGVSKLILRLERRLGILLFKRDTRQVVLTDEGRQYHAGALQVLASMAELEAQSAVDRNASVAGKLKILCSSSIAARMLAPLVPEFMAAHPELKIEFTVNHVVPFQTLDSMIDLGFYSAEMPSSSLIARRIVTTSHVICASPEYLEQYGVPQTPDDLVDHRCLNLSMQAPCNHWPVRLPDGDLARLDISPAITADNSEILMALTLAGSGIGRFMEFQARGEIEAGRLVSVLDDYNPCGGQAIYAVYHSRRYVSRRIQTFLDFVEQRLSQVLDGPAPPQPIRLVSSRP